MFFRRLLCIWILISFLLTMVIAPQGGFAQTILDLPEPGTMVSLSTAYTPVMIKGLKINPTNPLNIDFIVATGNSQLTARDPQLKKESEKLIKYFFAALTLPEKDVWVNLSPYEKDRIIPQATGNTEMGRDMLAQDYILKQITASLIYPEKGLGKDFWNKIYSEASKRFGTTQIPVNTFNKVWIVADKASVYEAKDTVFVVDSHLKVMLDEDYTALNKHEQTQPIIETHALGNQVVREIVLPALEKEVNEGKNFANLRQIFHSLILAKWYKETLKTALLNQVYSNRDKVGGLSFKNASLANPQYIYQQYLKAYKKGVFNYIKEDIDQTSQQRIPRKYFSGGVDGAMVIGKASLAQTVKSFAAAGLIYLVGSLATTSSAAPIAPVGLSNAYPSIASNDMRSEFMAKVDKEIQLSPGKLVLLNDTWSGATVIGGLALINIWIGMLTKDREASLYATVHDVLRQKVLRVDFDSIPHDADFRKDLGMDNNDIKWFINRLGKERQIEIPEAMADQFITIKDVVDYLMQFPDPAMLNHAGPGEPFAAGNELKIKDADLEEQTSVKPKPSQEITVEDTRPAGEYPSSVPGSQKWSDEAMMGDEDLFAVKQTLLTFYEHDKAHEYTIRLLGLLKEKHQRKLLAHLFKRNYHGIYIAPDVNLQDLINWVKSDFTDPFILERRVDNTTLNIERSRTVVRHVNQHLVNELAEYLQKSRAEGKFGVMSTAMEMPVVYQDGPRKGKKMSRAGPGGGGVGIFKNDLSAALREKGLGFAATVPLFLADLLMDFPDSQYPTLDSKINAYLKEVNGARLMDIDLPLGGGTYPFSVFYYKQRGVPVIQIFDRSGNLFNTLYSQPNPDSAGGYIEAILLPLAAIEIPRQIGLQFEAYHFHDWQATLGNMLLSHKYADQEWPLGHRPARVQTMHNLEPQGRFMGHQPVDQKLYTKLVNRHVIPAGSPHMVDLFNLTDLDAFKGDQGISLRDRRGDQGLEFYNNGDGQHLLIRSAEAGPADGVLFVSEGHMKEALAGGKRSFGLAGMFQNLVKRGIPVNGIHNGIFAKDNLPENLKALKGTEAEKYGFVAPAGSLRQYDDQAKAEWKRLNKLAVQKKLNDLYNKDFEINDRDILLGIPTRIVKQKGLDLMMQQVEINGQVKTLLEHILDQQDPKTGAKVQFVILGTPNLKDPWGVEQAKFFREFLQLHPAYKDRFVFVEKFDADLAKQIGAGGDLFPMTSIDEPGGIANSELAVLLSLGIVSDRGGLDDFFKKGGTPIKPIPGYEIDGPHDVVDLNSILDPKLREAVAQRQAAAKVMVARVVDFMNVFTGYRQGEASTRAEYLGYLKMVAGYDPDWGARVDDYTSFYKDTIERAQAHPDRHSDAAMTFRMPPQAIGVGEKGQIVNPLTKNFVTVELSDNAGGKPVLYIGGKDVYQFETSPRGDKRAVMVSVWGKVLFIKDGDTVLSRAINGEDMQLGMVPLFNAAELQSAAELQGTTQLELGEIPESWVASDQSWANYRGKAKGAKDFFLKLGDEGKVLAVFVLPSGGMAYVDIAKVYHIIFPDAAMFSTYYIDAQAKHIAADNPLRIPMNVGVLDSVLNISTFYNRLAYSVVLSAQGNGQLGISINGAKFENISEGMKYPVKTYTDEGLIEVQWVGGEAVVRNVYPHDGQDPLEISRRVLVKPSALAGTRIMLSTGLGQGNAVTFPFTKELMYAGREGAVVKEFHLRKATFNLQRSLRGVEVTAESIDEGIPVQMTVTAVTTTVPREETAPPKETSKEVDLAMNGGIDLDASKINMRRQGSGIDIKFDPALVAQFQLGHFDGIVPVITGITPIANFYSLLGLQEPAATEDLAA